MLTLRYNPASMRYENIEYVPTLTCGTRFNLYCDDVLVAGRIEYHNTEGY